MTDLYWLEAVPNWRSRLRSCLEADDVWAAAVALANSRLDFLKTNQLDEVVQHTIGETAPQGLATKQIRLAILGSCTTAHLHAAIRVAALRRNIHLIIYEAGYGQYWQELADPDSPLNTFKPSLILFVLDAHHIAAGVNAAFTVQEADAALEEIQTRLRECWRLAHETFRCPVIQQAPLPVHASLLGQNEHRLPGSKATFIRRFNAELRPIAEEAHIDILSLDERAARDGLAAWHDHGLWLRAKQEVSPFAAPMYGELIGRMIAARQGRSYKCLVLDLDNTLWGGVIGDDGMEGIVLGQGSALGEAFLAFQDYARELARRGVILAVCSKNNEASALEPFERHPDMILRRSDIAAFVANWSDKAANIRSIAEQLNIALSSLVFVDDNPFERSLIRQELPQVAVPEIGDDPASYAQILADAGYFEGLAITSEDRERTGQYQGNRSRAELRASSTDLPGYLRSLKMQLRWRPFDQIGLSRTVQLINKTNQFNLTTRRYTEEEIVDLMRDRSAFGLQLRLLDRFGDNGIIGVVIGKMRHDEASRLGHLIIDTWLMSCRVLGRQVEATTLNLVASQAQRLGARRLIGKYVPTKYNGMVGDHYEKLGFVITDRDKFGCSEAVLDLATFAPAETFIATSEDI
ncbi:HAD family hydrolase [Acidisoma sp. S159]|uniref:HAD-IIIC family phosphatase n=1 Tax=Acidisoma sp. S159 TaxID=1747225 RepID=UPI00131AE781|nr:HAD-IIIC family phosphatase [Acidisoma sp. S159]